MDEEQVLPDFLTLVLDPPVSVNGAQLGEITLKPPTLGQVRDAQMKLDDALDPTRGSMREYQLTFVQLNSAKGRLLVDALPMSAVRRGIEFLEAYVVAPLPDLDQNADPSRLVLTLDAPLRTNSGGEVYEIELREPTGGEMRKAEELIDKRWSPGPVRRYQARLIELVSGLPSTVIAQLPIGKAREAIRFLEHFEDSARQIGTR